MPSVVSRVIAYTYDGANRLTHVRDWADRTTVYTYDALHRKTGIDYPSAATGTWTWDDASRLERIVYHNGASNIVDRTYTHDPHGNLQSLTIDAGLLPQVTPIVRRLTQDSADQLASLQTKSTPATPDWTIATPAYDTRGNLTSDGATSYTYDYENRLQSVQSASSAVDHLYAPDGTRLARTENGVTRVTLLDHGSDLQPILVELDASGTPLRYYIWADQLLAHVHVAGTVRYYHADGQGTTLALTDDLGVMTDQFFISPYGEEMNRTGSTATPFVWVGGYGVWNEGNNLYRMQARYYHIGHKRWLSRDPLGLAGGPNLYLYANGNPLAFIDPFGLQAEQSGQPRYRSGSAFANLNRTPNPTDYLGDLQSQNAQRTAFVEATAGGDINDFAHLAQDSIFFINNPSQSSLVRLGTTAALAAAPIASVGAVRMVAPNRMPGRSSDFVVTPRGEAIPVPSGATGPTPTRAPGFQFTGGSGGHGLDPRTTGVRIMDANANQGQRAVFMNRQGQTVNPATGRTVPNSDPAAHHPLQPFE